MNEEMRVPRLGVSVALRRKQDGAFLLVRRGRPPAKDLWAFPGGKVEFGETLETAAARELNEETGLKIDADDLIFVRPVEIIESVGKEPASHFVLMVFTATISSGEPVAGDDAIETRFFNLSDMDAVNITASTLEIAVELTDP